MPKHIIVVYDHASITGGQSKVAIASAIGLRRAGHPVTYFAASGPVDAQLTDAGVEVVCLGQHDILSDPSRARSAVRLIWNQEAADALARLLAKQDRSNTVVHWHGYAKSLSPSVGRAIVDSGIPHVYTHHEYFFVCPNGGFFHYPDNKICTRVPMGRDCLTTDCDSRHAVYKGWRVARHVVMNRMLGMPQDLRDHIFISETQRAALEPYLPAGARKHRVSNPVEVAPCEPADVGSSDVFLFVGRLSPEKGGLLFAQAAREAGVKAVFVGEGEQRDAILAANPDAVVTGWQSPASVMDWLRRSRCLVFSSVWYECQPLVPVEALANGVPVIAGRWNAAAEMVEPGINGAVWREPTVPALVDALRAMTADAARQMGQAAHARYWQSPMTLERHVETLQALYETL